MAELFLQLLVLANTNFITKTREHFILLNFPQSHHLIHRIVRALDPIESAESN